MHRCHGGIAGGQLQGGHQFVAHAGAVGVAPLRTVEGDPQLIGGPLQPEDRVITRVDRPNRAAREPLLVLRAALQRRVRQRLDHQRTRGVERGSQSDHLRQGGGRLRIPDHGRFNGPGGLDGVVLGPDPRSRRVFGRADQDVRAYRRGRCGRGGAGGDDHARPAVRRLQLGAAHRLVQVDEQDGLADRCPQLVARPPGPDPVQKGDRVRHVQGVEHPGSVSRSYPDPA